MTVLGEQGLETKVPKNKGSNGKHEWVKIKVARVNDFESRVLRTGKKKNNGQGTGQKHLKAEVRKNTTSRKGCSWQGVGYPNKNGGPSLRKTSAEGAPPDGGGKRLGLFFSGGGEKFYMEKRLK